ncbi:MAG: hypothetical protein HZB38_14335 [Planctomycetes bacterium]|nr:hypothetical protein [Planctomycetota bacterium]
MMLIRVQPTCMTLASMLLAVFARPESVASADDGVVAEIQTSNAARLSSVRDAVIEETIQEARQIDDGVVEERRAERTRGVLEQREAKIAAAAKNGLDEKRLRNIEESVAGQLEFVDDLLVIERLNAETQIERRTTIDFSGRRIRRDDRDARDVDSICRKNGLSKWHRQSLEKNGVAIMDGAKPEIRLHPNVGKLATLMSYRTIRWDSEMIKLGVIPSEMFSPGRTIESRDGDNGAVILTVRESANSDKMVELTVDPRLGAALTRMRTFEGERLIEEITASEFRDIDGVSVPFKTRLAIHTPRQDGYVAERKVKSVKLNAGIKDADLLFGIPKDYSVQDISALPKVE